MTPTEYTQGMEQFRSLLDQEQQLTKAMHASFDVAEWNRLRAAYADVRQTRLDLGVRLYDHVHGGITVGEAVAQRP